MKPSQIPLEKKVFMRTSSTENWEVTGENQAFAEVSNTKKFFHAKIHLNRFGSFDKDEVDVYLHDFDVQIRAVKNDPLNPNRPTRILTRQYRLPCDIDLTTISLKRNDAREEVNVKASKIPERGLLIGLNIVDATAAGQKVTRIQAF
ncbi:SHSP domain-containing protein [Aphelenchoides bicaudatus]|nr:SHSP domain-containing protein [Aphelenchoides bicaudatus]